MQRRCSQVTRPASKPVCILVHRKCACSPKGQNLQRLLPTPASDGAAAAAAAAAELRILDEALAPLLLTRAEVVARAAMARMLRHLGLGLHQGRDEGCL